MLKSDSKTSSKRLEKSCPAGSQGELDCAPSAGSGGTTTATKSNPGTIPTRPTEPRRGEMSALGLTNIPKSLSPRRKDHTAPHLQNGTPQPFEGLVIDHSRWVEAQASMMGLIQNACGISVVLLFGPTGSGKTVLEQAVRRQHSEPCGSLTGNDQSAVPSCYVQWYAPIAALSLRELNTQTLVALNEPHLDNEATGVGFPYHGLDGADIRRSLRMALKKRKTRLLIYDGAERFTKMAGLSGGQSHLDYFKSIASLSGTFFLLAGMYELLKLLPRRGQCVRGILPVHLARYRADDPNDWSTFREMILAFQRALPIRKSPALIDQAEFLYRGSLGCVGLLTYWLNSAMALTMKSSSKRMTVEHLKATVLPKHALDRVEQDIREGEGLVANHEELNPFTLK